MKKVFLLVVLLVFQKALSQVVASFTTPDTVCINQSFSINNTSTNATNYNWNFCDAGYSATVSGVNLGNIGGNFSVPVFMDYVYDNGNYYGFVFNFNPGGITRLDFGNSLLNTPTAVFLGNPNGILWSGAGGEDIKLVKQNGNWIAIVVGGSIATGTGPKIIKLDFGTNITNTNPTITNWGNVGSLDQPHQLHLWQENNNWYGIVFNAESNTITRINFSNSFNNIPTGVNLGNIGNLNWPSSFQVINDNGIQRIFVSNTKGHSISRLDFGNSLLNIPTGVNLGNPNGVLSWPRGIQIYNTCGEIFAYVCNQSGHDISKLNFNGSLLNVPTATSLGNIGTLNGPHSFSKEFIVGNDKYIFIPNTGSNTLTRLKISGCTNSSIPSSSLQTPPQISYNTAGTYNITLTVDEGLATQNSFCKQIVVQKCPDAIASFTAPDTVCTGQSFSIANTSTNAASYNWNFCDAGSNANVSGVNLGNIGGNFSVPVFMDYVLDNGNYYGFVVNFNPSNITRLDFGNSLLNTPTATLLSNISNQLWNGGKGLLAIKIVKQNGNWFAILTGGSNNVGDPAPRLVKLNFGNSITNNSPTVIDWGNIGNIAQPHQLEMWQENNIWYGLLFNSETNTITRINFTNNFNNIPTGVNMGNIGNLNFPSHFDIVTISNNFYVFVTNTFGNSVSRLDFGNSLLNTPTGINLGNVSNTLSWPRGINILKSCGDIYGYIVNQQSNSIAKINFNSNITNTPTSVNLGNIGNQNNASSFSRIFTLNNDSYYFLTNSVSNTLSRLKISGCTNSSIPNSSLKTPPQISYNTAGTYNITLTVDEGLPTQNSFCKQIVVQKCDTPNPNCKGSFKFTGRERVTPPQANFKKYFAATGFTWECWFNGTYYANNNTTADTRNKLIAATDIPSTTQDIVLGFGWPSVAQKKQLCFVADGPNGNADRDNNPCKYFPTGGFIANKWYHVAAVRDYNNNTSSLYVDGVLVDSKTNTHAPLNPNGNLGLPNFYFGSLVGIGFPDSSFTGKMDEIRIWNYARTATQIQAAYDKCINASETGLVAYYHSTSGKDATPNANDASLDIGATVDNTDNAPLSTTCFQSTFKNFDTTICYGQTFMGKNTTGNYTFPAFTNFYGCDSIFTLNLKVLNQPIIHTDTTTDCKSITIGPNTFSKDTLLQISSIKYNGFSCDSFINMKQLIIKKLNTILPPITICKGTSYWGHSTAGNYDSVFKTSTNCDSVVTLTLVLSSFINDTKTVNICYGDTFRNANTNATFIDTIRTPGSCDTLRITKLFVGNKIKKQLPISGFICINDYYLLDAGKFKKYLWNTGDTTETIKATKQGWYKVQVTDTNGCRQKDSFNLMNVYVPQTDFIDNKPITVCLGEKYLLKGFVTYKWNTGETTNTVTLLGLNKYFVTVTDVNGCHSKDTLKVEYSNKLDYNIPSAFSPNGDNINDEFKPFANSNCLTSFNMQIFNRWGQKVFGTLSTNTAWTGKSNDSNLPSDVYFYIINFKTITGIDETKSGYVSLFR